MKYRVSFLLKPSNLSFKNRFEIIEEEEIVLKKLNHNDKRIYNDHKNMNCYKFLICSKEDKNNNIFVVAIKKRKAQMHRNLIFFALICSLIFLLSYVCYHFTTSATIYGDQNGDGILSEMEKEDVGSSRIFYLIILLTHIALAALSFPFILMSLTYALTHQFDKHKRMTRWVFPVWLYVAITGPWLVRIFDAKCGIPLWALAIRARRKIHHGRNIDHSL